MHQINLNKLTSKCRINQIKKNLNRLYRVKVLNYYYLLLDLDPKLRPTRT